MNIELNQGMKKVLSTVSDFRISFSESLQYDCSVKYYCS